MKDLDLPAELVDMEDMENKKNLRQFDQAFVSPNEEVQVKFLMCVKTYNSSFKAIHYAVRKYFSKNKTNLESLLSINHRVWVAWYPVQHHRPETLLQQD